MKRQNLIDTGSIGTCVVRASPRAQVKTQPRVRPRAARVEKPKEEDSAVWLMRFLALALILFVLVILVFQG